MIYDLHQKTIISDGDLPTRNYYIPFSKSDAFGEKTKSDLLKSVYEWKISNVKKFSQSIFMQKSRTKRSLPIVCKRLCKITSDDVFPFEYTPPTINGDVMAVVYESKVRYNDLHDKYYLVFESVSACFYLFFNGKYVGYSARGQTMTEFDVTSYMKNENDVKVVVLDRCALSYISAIKPIRPFGITGDVYVLNRREGHLTEYSVSTKLIDGKWKINFDGDEDTEVSVFDGRREIGKQTGNNLSFEIDNPKTWSSEQPYLYRVLLHCQNEYIEENVGLIDVKINGKDLMVNGERIFLKGITRSPFTTYGCFESDKMLCDDVIRLKRCGVNAVYSPNYPANPEMAKLCDKYGLYLIESIEVNYSNGDCLSANPYGGIKSLIECNDFEKLIKSRIECACKRDKNRTSVIMWSIGGKAQSANAKNLKNIDERAYIFDENSKYNGNKTKILVSNENDIGDINSFEKDEKTIEKSGEKNLFENRLLLSFNYLLCFDFEKNNVDMQNQVYVDVDKPTVLFTDVFSMHGINCLYENEAATAGVFPCEFNYLKTAVNSFYGLYDRKTKRYSALLKNILNAYFPIDVLRENDKFIIKNNNRFIDGKNFRGKCYVKVDGKQVDGINIDVSKLNSGESLEIKIDDEKYGGNFISVEFVFKELIYGSGIVKQFIIRDCIALYKPISFSSIQLYGNVMSCKKYSVRFSDNGLISSIVAGNKKYVVGQMRFCIDRPPLDMAEKQVVSLEKFNEVKFVVSKIKNESNVLYVSGSLLRPNMAEVLRIEIEYSFFDNGTIIMKIDTQMPDYIDGLYRFGLVIPLCGNFKKLAYFGRGKEECYFGEENYSVLGEYTHEVKNFAEAMPIFKESGSRSDVRRVTFFKKRDKISFYPHSPISFKVSSGKMRVKKNIFVRWQKVCYLNLDFCMTGRIGEYIEKGKLKNKTSHYAITIEV